MLIKVLIITLAILIFGVILRIVLSIEKLKSDRKSAKHSSATTLIDQEILKIQKSTRASISFFTSLHNYLRMNNRWYYNWHLKSYAGKVHYCTLFCTILTGLLLSYFSIFGIPKIAKATSFSSYQTGNWSDQCTWTVSCDGGVPVSGDNITIAAGQTVTILSSNPVDMGAGTVTINGTLSLNDNLISGGIVVSTTGTLSGTRNITVNNGNITGDGTINMTAGTVTLAGTGNFGGVSDWTFSNLTFGDGATENTTTKTGSNTISVKENLQISSNHVLLAGSGNWNLSWGTNGLVNITQISGGYSKTVALDNTGAVYTWGYNEYSQLGNGNTGTNQNTSVKVLRGEQPGGATYLSNIIQISSGTYHTIALDNTGAVYTWGFNGTTGQLGNGTSGAGTDKNTPVRVLRGEQAGATYLSNIEKIAAGDGHSVALDNTGAVYTWGYNANGQLGNGNTGTNRSSPVRVLKGDQSGTTYLANITQIAAGYTNTVAVDNTGAVYIWGSNAYGEIGNGLTGADRNTPVRVLRGEQAGTTYLANITQIFCGLDYVVAIDNTGAVYSWGYNNNGQLGNGTSGAGNNHSSPVRVIRGEQSGTTYLSNITGIAGGRSSVTALDNTGAVYTWGFNNYGQLGNGNNTNQSSPVRVLKGEEAGATYLNNIIQVGAGEYHLMALDNTGAVYTWGFNNYGQLGNGTNGAGTNKNTPVGVKKGVQSLSGVLINGTLQAEGSVLTNSGTWTNAGTFEAGTSTVAFNAPTGTQTLNSVNQIFNNLTHSGIGTLQLQTNPVDINGSFTNSNGIFDANGLNITVAKDWNISGGSFSTGATPGAQTTTFDSINPATISGSSTFNNLTMDTSVDGAKQINFTAGTTQTISAGKTWMLNGAAGKVLTLRSTSNSDPWYFNILADFTAGPYVDVEDSNNITNSYQITPDTADINSGNNLPGWLFTITNTNPNPPTSLGPTSFVDGGSQYNHNPTLDFVLFDPDSSDQVSYQLQISTSEDFLSGIIVDFKSALADQGSRSFVVGQDLLGGAYSVGSSGQNLPEGEYFWRVRAFDGQNASSGWSVPGQASVFDIKISEADPVLPVTTVIPAPPVDSQTEEGIIAPENVVPLPESEPTVPQDVTAAQNQIALSQINKISLFDKIFSTIKEINLAIAEATHLKEKTVPLLASVSTLIVIAASAAATPLANNVTLFSFPEYLRSLLYSLFSLSSRRKRKEWGKVLEAGTALPIVQAKINLIKVEHPEAGPDAIKKLVASTYSGKDGSYAFLADPGQYQLVVEKDMFSVADVKGYYFDQILHVKTDKDSLIVPTIILSMKQEAAQKKLNTLRKLSLFEKVLFYLSFAFLIFGSITAISGLLKYPTNLLIVIIACLYPFLWFFTIKSLLRVSPVGNIRNAKSKQSVPLALIRIMDLTGKKLIKTAVSNEKGKYKTLIDKGIYKIFVTKSGYKQLTSVELNAKKNINTINQTIEVEKY